MKKEYDFSKSRKNPYAKQLKRQITIRLDASAVAYFKQMAAELGMPYQNLINLFLRDCAQQKRRPSIQWLEAASTPVQR
jgi:predicted DNA binding CopG/RHH family protein